MPPAIRFRDLLHPVQAAKAAKAGVAKRVDIWSFGREGRRHFRGDARYDLRNVREGFRSHIEESVNDVPLLQRICAAYKKAVEGEPSASAAYRGQADWRTLREGRLRPFIQALTEGDVTALGRMLPNFYRDPCSSGLLAAPHGMSAEYFGSGIKDIYCDYYLTHVLSRLDYWKDVTAGRFGPKDLAGPGVGNPFGVVIEGIHIAVGSEYSHYCAHRVIRAIKTLSGRSSITPTVAEIGSGFGATAYYLVRDGKPVKYIGFDFPERIALSSYYLLKAFPKHEFFLFGERPLTRESVGQSEIVLLPSFAIAKMPLRAVDLTFSSLAFGPMSQETMREYLKEIDQITRTDLLVIDNQAASGLLKGFIDKDYGLFRLNESLSLAWHSRGIAGAGRKNEAGSSSSEMLEQTFLRAMR